MSCVDPLEESEISKSFEEGNAFLELRVCVNEAFNLYADLHEVMQDLVKNKEKLQAALEGEDKKTIKHIIHQWEFNEKKQNHWYVSIKNFCLNGSFCFSVNFLCELEKQYGEAVFVGNISFEQTVELLRKIEFFENFLPKFKGDFGDEVDRALLVLRKNARNFEACQYVFDFDDEGLEDIKNELKKWNQSRKRFVSALKKKLFRVAVLLIDKEGRAKGWCPEGKPTADVVLKAYVLQEALKKKLEAIGAFGDVRAELEYWQMQFSGVTEMAKTLDACLSVHSKRIKYLAQVLDPSSVLTGGSCLGDIEQWSEDPTLMKLEGSKQEIFRCYEDLHQFEMSLAVRLMQNRQGVVCFSSKGEVTYDSKTYHLVSELTLSNEKEGIKSFCEALFVLMKKEIKKHENRNRVVFKLSCDNDESAHILGFCFEPKSGVCAFRDSNTGEFLADSSEELQKIFRAVFEDFYSSMYRKCKVFLDQGNNFVPVMDNDRQIRIELKNYFVLNASNKLLERELFEKMVACHKKIKNPTIQDELFICVMFCMFSGALKYRLDAKNNLYVEYLRLANKKAEACLLRSREESLVISAISKLLLGMELVEEENATDQMIQVGLGLLLELYDKQETAMVKICQEHGQDFLEFRKTVKALIGSNFLENKHLKKLDNMINVQSSVLMAQAVEQMQLCEMLSIIERWEESRKFVATLGKIESGARPFLPSKASEMLVVESEVDPEPLRKRTNIC